MSEPILTSLKYLTGMNLDRFKPILTCQNILGHVRSIWTRLHLFGQVWTNLNNCVQIWTCLIQNISNYFSRTCKNKTENAIFTPTLPAQLIRLDYSNILSREQLNSQNRFEKMLKNANCNTRYNAQQCHLQF